MNKSQPEPQPEPQTPYRKDQTVERNLDQLNRLLEPLDREIADPDAAPGLPVVFVLGTPRSGHTLAAQYLIDRYALAYPSNFIARFWRAPVLGARLQSAALDQTLGGGRPRESFESEHGLTSGPYGLHEFGYFWTDVFQFGASHAVPAKQLERIDRGRLRSVVAGIERESGGLPVLFKNGTLGFQAHFLAQVFPAAVFVVCRRDPIWTAQSILEMRLKRFGKRDVWFGFRPPEYEVLRNLPWQEQIAGQITMTVKAVQAELDHIPSARVVAIDYEDFCSDPGAAVLEFEKAMENAGHQPAARGPCPESFDCRNERRVSNGDWSLLQKGLERFGTLTV